MRIPKGQGFSVPKQIFEDGLPYSAFCLLLFLFKDSACSGHCNPGYDAMLHALHTRCRTVISKNLKLLERRGWFNYAKRHGNQNKEIWLTIPARYAPKKKDKPVILSIAKQ